MAAASSHPQPSPTIAHVLQLNAAADTRPAGTPLARQVGGLRGGGCLLCRLFRSRRAGDNAAAITLPPAAWERRMLLMPRLQLRLQPAEHREEGGGQTSGVLHEHRRQAATAAAAGAGAGGPSTAGRLAAHLGKADRAVCALWAAAWPPSVAGELRASGIATSAHQSRLRRAQLPCKLSSCRDSVRAPALAVTGPGALVQSLWLSGSCAAFTGEISAHKRCSGAGQGAHAWLDGARCAGRPAAAAAAAADPCWARLLGLQASAAN